tara:strand:- start:391 stop:1869 length:1479 start_codon:yes stop_codon:yes gene_type:complete
MKEQTINLYEALEKLPLEKIAKGIPLKVYDNFNNLIWGNDLGGEEDLKIFPITTNSGIPLASVQTRESHKGLLRKIILKEISRFVKEEIQESRRDEVSIFYSDLENLTFNKTFLDSSFTGKEVEKDIIDILYALKKYFPYEGCNIHITNGENSLEEFLEISSDGEKKKGEYWDFPLKEVSAIAFNTQTVYHSNDATNDPYFGQLVGSIKKCDIKNFIVVPLTIFDNKQGALAFYNECFLRKGESFNPSWHFKNLINLIAYKIFLKRRGIEVFKKRNEKKITNRFIGPKITNHTVLQKKIKSTTYPQERTIIAMYGGIHKFLEGGNKIQRKTMSSLLQFHNSNVSKVVNSFGGTVHQFNNEHFLAFWNFYEDMDRFDHFASRAAINLVHFAHDYLHLHFKSYGFRDFHFSVGLVKEKVQIDSIKSRGENFPLIHGNIIDTTKQIFEGAPNCTAYFHEKIINELVKNDLPPMRKLFNVKLRGEAQGARIFSYKI